ncbi:MAG: carboxymuconolactone decarboxylase family protein, partial [Gammaproteobacteria bacterium]|nr:carboxymuconolactone decarboxylase family protein [Gammaproteobacteria bacterium]
QVLNLYRTIGHLGEIGPEFIRLGNKILFKGSLPPALRELAILLVGHIAQAPYEFTKHVEIGRKTGLSQAQIDALADWRAAAVLRRGGAGRARLCRRGLPRLPGPGRDLRRGAEPPRRRAGRGTDRGDRLLRDDLPRPGSPAGGPGRRLRAVLA